MGNIFLVVIKEVDVRGFLFPFKIKKSGEVHPKVPNLHPTPEVPDENKL